MFLLIFILLLVGLILVHEFGHFLIAKVFGIRVDEFGVFFPPRLFKVRLGETDYSLNSIPIGGFVKIYGENAEEGGNDPRSFTKKNRFIQALVILAGVVCNLLIGWLLLSSGYMVGMPTSVDHVGYGTVTNAQVEVVEVIPGSPADKAGVEAGDVITGAQTGTATLPPGSDSTQFQQFVVAHQNESVVLTVVRNGETDHFLAQPASGVVAGRKALGIALDDVGILKLSPPLALLQGGLLAEQMTVATGEGLGSFLWSLIRGEANFSQVAGPIGIASLGSAAVAEGFAATVTLVALISINLALVNLLPIPGLDGGRLLFVTVEAIIRRPISPRIATALTVAGFALLILVLLVISYHDVLRLIQPS